MTTHGTRACYVAGCRRPDCTRANADYQRDRLREQPRDYTLDQLVDHLLDVARSYAAHGTRQRYRQGCTCADCRRANTLYVMSRNVERAMQDA